MMQADSHTSHHLGPASISIVRDNLLSSKLVRFQPLVFRIFFIGEMEDIALFLNLIDSIQSRIR